MGGSDCSTAATACCLGVVVVEVGGCGNGPTVEVAGGLELDGQGAAGVVELVERGDRQGLGAGIQVGHLAHVGRGAAVALGAHLVVAVDVAGVQVLVEIETALVAHVEEAVLLAERRRPT